MTAIHVPVASLDPPIPIADAWAFGVFCSFLLFLSGYADWFIRCRDVGPPRMRIDPVIYWMLLVIGALCEVRAVVRVGPVVLLACIWLYCRASRKDRAREKYLNRDSVCRTVRIVPDLSRRLAWKHPLLLLPQVCLDRLSDAEVDALLARQVVPVSGWALLLALVIPLLAVIFGLWAAPPSLAPLVSIACILCQWALIVWVHRRLDAQADAKAIQAIGDPATYIQALVKADGLMKEIPPRLRMSTWWLFPVSLEARIAAITPPISEPTQR